MPDIAKNTKREPTLAEEFDSAFERVSCVSDNVNKMSDSGNTTRKQRIQKLEEAYNVLITLNDKILRTTNLVVNKLQQLHAEQKLAEDFEAKCLEGSQLVETVDQAIGAIDLLKAVDEDQVKEMAQRFKPNVGETHSKSSGAKSDPTTAPE